MRCDRCDCLDEHKCRGCHREINDADCEDFDGLCKSCFRFIKGWEDAI